MNMKTFIIGIILLVGAVFVGSEYGIFQELSVATSPDSPELVHQTYKDSSIIFHWINPTSACVGKGYPMLTEDNYIIYNRYGFGCYANIVTDENREYLLNLPVWNKKIEYCYFNAEDPNLYDDVVELKCIGYCAVGQSVCEGDVLQTCNIEGTAIDKVLCEHTCENGVCIIPEVFFALNLQTADSYIYGDDVKVVASVIVLDKPLANTQVRGKLLKDGGVVAETIATTDSNGIANIVFQRVEGVGTLQLEASTTRLDETIIETKDIYFTGDAVIFASTTYSYIQYTTDEVEFNVNIKDGSGRYISPTSGTLTVMSTMTGNEIISSTSEYLGEGDYLIKSVVSGPGTYNGKVGMTYQGVDFESIGINIDVRDVALEVGVSDFAPSAVIGETKTLQFNVVSSIGGHVDPDAVEIVVSYPSGYVTDRINMIDMTRISEGVYEFDYTFDEVEKYSFDIYVDKEEHVRGHGKATVAVTGITDDDISLLAWLISNTKMMFIVVIVILSIFFVYKRSKK